MAQNVAYFTYQSYPVKKRLLNTVNPPVPITRKYSNATVHFGQETFVKQKYVRIWLLWCLKIKELF